MLVSNWILEYYQQIKDGTVTAGKWITLLYEKVIADLENKAYFFDAKKANRAIRFIEAFVHHSKGKLAPGTVKLETWQKALISCIFGLVDENGIRQYREVFIVMGRKDGKSLLASGIAEYCAYADGEYGGEIYFVAPKLDQADIVCSDFWQSVQNEPELLGMTAKRASDFYIKATNTTIKKVAFNEKKSDGYNPSCTICDEIAAWPAAQGLKQYAVFSSALGAREQPLIVSITTANYINDGPYDDLFARSTRVLKGDAKERRLLPFIYCIDDIRKWNDINELQKALPNLGVSVSVDYILNEIAKAEQSLPAKAEFICKFCCIKQSSSMAWLNADDVIKCCGDALDFANFERHYAIVGVDLSRTIDLSAVTCIIEKNGKLYIFAHFFMPEGAVDDAEARDGVPYKIYAQRGFLTLCEGNVVDYRQCFDWIIDLRKKYKITPMRIMYDRYSAAYLIQDLQAAGLKCDDCFQGENMTPGIREFEGLVKNGDVCIGDNDLLKIHLLNAALKHNAETERVKLVKLKVTDHVDGTAAILDGIIGRQKWWGEIGKYLQNVGK